MKKDTTYYNHEGRQYSQKRYPTVSTDYVHFFFKKRLEILIELLTRIIPHVSSPASLIEVGCADGVVLRSIQGKFPQIERLVGVDISPDMVEEAKKQSPKSIEFHVRDREVFGNFDVVVEVGVINLSDFETEILSAKKNLKQEGYFIASLASKTSLRTILKFNKYNDGFKHLLKFKEYEDILRLHFTIVDAIPYGLFVPFLWKFPRLARIIQPRVEVLMGSISPDLFHEKIYLLKLPPILDISI